MVMLYFCVCVTIEERRRLDRECGRLRYLYLREDSKEGGRGFGSGRGTHSGTS
jgi:hypothetical protein